jgi:hypothetical protein
MQRYVYYSQAYHFKCNLTANLDLQNYSAAFPYHTHFEMVQVISFRYRAGIARSVYRQDTGLTTERSEFESP